MDDVGLGVRNVRIRNITKDRLLGMYIRHHVSCAQLEEMGTADVCLMGRAYHISAVDQVGMKVRTPKKTTPGHDQNHVARHYACPVAGYPEEPRRNQTGSEARPPCRQMTNALNKISKRPSGFDREPTAPTST
jgi:hypothetical protein